MFFLFLLFFVFTICHTVPQLLPFLTPILLSLSLSFAFYLPPQSLFCISPLWTSAIVGRNVSVGQRGFVVIKQRVRFLLSLSPVAPPRSGVVESALALSGGGGGGGADVWSPGVPWLPLAVCVASVV